MNFTIHTSCMLPYWLFQCTPLKVLSHKFLDSTLTIQHLDHPGLLFYKGCWENACGVPALRLLVNWDVHHTDKPCKLHQICHLQVSRSSDFFSDISIIICLYSLLFMQGPGATSWELDEVLSSALWCDFVENCEQQTCSLLLWHRTYSTWLYKPVAHVTWIMQTPVHDARTYCPSCVTAGGYLYTHGHAVLLYMYHLTCCSCMCQVSHFWIEMKSLSKRKLLRSWSVFIPCGCQSHIPRVCLHT